MKPTGLASRKKARSRRLRDGPAQPKMTALGSRLGKNAPLAPLAKLCADALGLARVGDRAGMDAVVDAAVAEVGALHREGERAHEIAVLALNAVDLGLGDLRRLYRRELQSV